jgi:hypothetical protein
MVSGSRFRSWLPLPVLALVALLSAVVPSWASVNTTYNCPTSGHSGNHDGVFNGFFVQGVPGINLHSVTLYYTTDTDGTYTLMLTARLGSYTGQQIGLTQTQTVTLSSTADTAVTWTFDDPTIASGSNLYFTHTESGPGGVQFNLQSNLCPGDLESVGTSAVTNNLSVAVILTQNITTTGCLSTNQILCIDNQPGDRRFRVTVTYATSQAGGKSGSGQAISLSSLGVNQGGLFWFFDPANPELLIKVLNGCPINQHFWVYYSAGTNVGLHVTVTDTTTGHTVTYTNPDLTAAPPVQDTGALSCS